MEIERYGIPTKLDTAPKGTLCKVANKLGCFIYLQINSNEENPEWILLHFTPHSYAKDQ